MIRADGGNGLPAALPFVHPDIPVRPCRAHKIRNIPNQFWRPDREDAKRRLHDIMNAPSTSPPRAAARRFADRWRNACPKAVECLRDAPDDLPARFRYPTPDGRRQVRTTNAIKRRFRGGGGPAKDTTHGHLPGPHPHGMRPLHHLPVPEQNDRTAPPFTVTHKS